MVCVIKVLGEWFQAASSVAAALLHPWQVALPKATAVARGRGDTKEGVASQ